MQDNNIADEKLVKLLQDPEHLKTGSFSYELSRLGYDLFGECLAFDGKDRLKASVVRSV